MVSLSTRPDECIEVCRKLRVEHSFPAKMPWAAKGNTIGKRTEGKAGRCILKAPRSAMAAPFLIVRARSRLYALPVTQVVQMLRMPALVMEGTRLGGGNVAGWLGVATLRGQQVVVLDLAALLELAEAAGLPERAPARVVAVRMLERLVLLAVDDVIGVKTLAGGQLQKIALPGAQELEIGSFDEGFARMLDAGGLLDEQVLQEMEQILTAPAAGVSAASHAEGAA